MAIQKPDPRTTVSFKAGDDLLGKFDDWTDSSQYESRSEALRTLMAQAVETPADRGTPLVPPAEDRLSKSYVRLCEAANSNGILRDDRAKSVISTTLGMPKSEVQPAVLKKLHTRSYLRRIGNIYGDTSWAIVGWDDE